MSRWSGVLTPIVTPFLDDALDEPGLRRNIAWLMRTPLTGLVVLGSNGEAPHLDDAEADRVIAVARLASHPNIIGMKESGGDTGQIAECITRTLDEFVMYAGAAATYFHALCAGCSGAVLAMASAVPDLCVEIWRLVRDHRIDDARRLQRRLAPLARAVGTAHGVPGLKAALDALRCAGGAPRPPLLSASTAAVTEILAHLLALGLVPVAAEASQPERQPA
jgi:dihydrodipicolinate synthase/N-acetylneuraminate lyase